MTMITPLGSRILPGGWGNYDDVQPFSMRSAAGYQEVLERLRHYVTDVLAPHIDVSFVGLESFVLQELQEFAAIQIPAAYGFYILQGPNIDLTGSADSTVAVNAFFNALPAGAWVIVPSTAMIKLSDTVVVPRRVKLGGEGTLKWVGGIAGKAALDIRGAGTVLDGVRLWGTVAPENTDPNIKQYGIQINAQNVTVANSFVDGIQQGIAVMPGGEWYGAIITNNHVLNVPGSGGGPSSLSTNGEDRGDGITVWGAGAVVTGNVVTAAAGTDARIGIHTEGLPNYETDPGPHSSSQNIIADNQVSGKFRRSIVSEYVANTICHDNAVSDFTWWGIAIIGGNGSTCHSNVVENTRAATDMQGASNSPLRCGIMVYGVGVTTSVNNNTIQSKAGAVLPYGIVAQTSGNGNRDSLSIRDNEIVDDNGVMLKGIWLNGAIGSVNDALVSGNRIKGFTVHGIYGWTCNDVEATRNRIEGVASGSHGGTADGIFFENATTGARVDGNTVKNTNTAIKLVNRNDVTTAMNNLLFNANVGVDYTGTAAQANAIYGNITSGVTTAQKNS